ncbi:hypothetical protein BDW59DRAFT_167539 [Aspergillus cavernicola]|uniref:SnoaL-like domain-containing protein n=1 Tax=Aspergillus cavernicola TaxID=176166 RepID=A0ABR4HD64_9EURO
MSTCSSADTLCNECRPWFDTLKSQGMLQEYDIETIPGAYTRLFKTVYNGPRLEAHNFIRSATIQMQDAIMAVVGGRVRVAITFTRSLDKPGATEMMTESPQAIADEPIVVELMIESPQALTLDANMTQIIYANFPGPFEQQKSELPTGCHSAFRLKWLVEVSC